MSHLVMGIVGVQSIEVGMGWLDLCSTGSVGEASALLEGLAAEDIPKEAVGGRGSIHCTIGFGTAARSAATVSNSFAAS